MQEYIFGAGPGESSRKPVEAPDTLGSITVARLLEVISGGECVGLADAAEPRKSVFLDGVPAVASDDTINFTPFTVEQRYGTASQTAVKGFSAVESIQAGSAIQLTTTSSVIKNAGADVDALRAVIRFPALFEQNENNGDTNGTTVSFRIRRRLGAGAYSTVRTETVTGKATQAFERDYLIERPSGTGVWNLLFERITADNTSLTKANDTFVLPPTEVINVTETYPGVSYMALTTNAKAMGNQFPVRSYDFIGIKVKVPSNYDVVTRTYTDPNNWDGTFKTLPENCDNPAWVLFYLLTDPDNGMGPFIDEEDVDQYSFYAAARYNDEFVPDGNGGTEPRFTFNYQLTTRGEAWKVIQELASAFRAVVYTSGGLVKLVQDRPVSLASARLITNSNVKDGEFEYISTRERARITRAIVWWTNPANNWLSEPYVYDDTTAQARYGINEAEVAAIGCTTEGQAHRSAKWVVESSISDTDAITFTVPFHGAGIEPYEVVKVADSHYAEVELEGRIVSKTSNTITLDKPVVVASGYTFDTVGSDGLSIETRTITSTGTSATITFSGSALTAPTGNEVVITGSVAPRPFRVTNILERKLGEYIISGVQYDPNKFGRIDDTFTLPPLVYQLPPNFNNVPPVTGITFTEESYVTRENAVRRFLNVKWTPPSNTLLQGYRVFWFRNDGNVNDAGFVEQPFLRIPADIDGLYTVTVYAINPRGVRSAPASDSADINISAPPGTALLDPVTTLQVKGGGSTFTGTTATLTWVDPNTNGASVRQGYEVKVKDAVTPSTVYRTEVVTTTEFVYDLIKQAQDNPSGPKRSFIVSVRVVDTFGRYSTATELTVNNPTPAAPSLDLSAGFDNVFIEAAESGSPEPDIIGMKVWRSSTTGFTPNDATNLVYDGPDRVYFSPVTVGTLWYYKAAFYDSFGKATADLNISAQQSAEAVDATPADPNEYTIVGLVFQANSPSTDQVAWGAFTVSKTSGDTGVGTSWNVTSGNATWTTGTLYLYWTEGGTTVQTTTTLTTAVGATKRLLGTYKGGLLLSTGNGDAFIDGANIYAQTIGATQLVAGSAVITGTAQLADAIITDAKVVNLNATKLVAASITADKMQANLFQADNVLTRGLTVRDASGNIILSSGTPLNLAGSNVTGAPAGTLNTGITLTSTPGTGTITISGAGGGSVTGVIMPGFTITSGNVGTYISSAAIGAAYIGVLAAGNIGANTISANSMVANLFQSDNVLTRGLTVRDGSGNIILSSGTPLNLSSSNVSNAPNAWLNSTITLSGSSGTITLNNAGGGTVTGIVMPGNPINTGNISTYISGAAIGTAYIANAAITNALIANLAVGNANIQNLAVSTLKLGDQAVTVPVGVNIPGGNITFGTSNFDMGQATITLDSVGSGGGVAVTVGISCTYSTGNDTNGTAKVELFRNGTLLRTFNYSDATGITTERYAGKSGYINSTKDSRPTVFVLFDQVNAGTYTYSLKASCARTSGTSTCSFSWSAGGIVLLGAKK